MRGASWLPAVAGPHSEPGFSSLRHLLSGLTEAIALKFKPHEL